MKILECTDLSEEQKDAIRQLWNEEYSVKLNLPDLEAFEKYLATVTGHYHYLLVNDLGEIQDWAFKFIRENERWFSLLVTTQKHGQGNGTRLLDKLKEAENMLNGWVVDHERDVKENGEAYRWPLPFYLKNGFRVIPEIRFENEKMSAVKIVWTANLI